jgi:hypothetical protein
VTRPTDPTPAQLQADMEAARIGFEQWRRLRRRTVIDETPSRKTLREEYSDKYAGLRADEARGE